MSQERVSVRVEGEGHSGFCQSGRGRSFQFLSEWKGKVIPVSVSAEGHSSSVRVEGHSGLSEWKVIPVSVRVEGEGHSDFCWSRRGRSFWFLSEQKGKVIPFFVRAEREGHFGFCQSGRGVIPVSVRAKGEDHSSFCHSRRGRSFQFLSEWKGKVIPVSAKAEGEGHSGFCQSRKWEGHSMYSLTVVRLNIKKLELIHQKNTTGMSE